MNHTVLTNYAHFLSFFSTNIKAVWIKKKCETQWKKRRVSGSQSVVDLTSAAGSRCCCMTANRNSYKTAYNPCAGLTALAVCVF